MFENAVENPVKALYYDLGNLEIEDVLLVDEFLVAFKLQFLDCIFVVRYTLCTCTPRFGGCGKFEFSVTTYLQVHMVFHNRTSFY